MELLHNINQSSLRESGNAKWIFIKEKTGYFAFI